MKLVNLSICTCLKIHFCQVVLWNICLKINAQLRAHISYNIPTFFEQCFLNSYLKFLLFLRFTDDISIIWSKNLSSNFIKYLNNFHPTFNFQLNPLSAFLWWFYVKLHNGHKDTTLYNKLTNNHGYLYISSRTY